MSLLFYQVIFVYELLGNEFELYIVIFVLLHWIVKLEVPYIYNDLFTIWCGDNAVPMEFGCG